MCFCSESVDFLHRGGACVAAGGACVAAEGVHGCRGACMAAGGACVVAGGGCVPCDTHAPPPVDRQTPVKT